MVPKFGFTAVKRNKLKRRLRELVRQQLLPSGGSTDLLIRARRDAYDVDYDSLREAIAQVVAQLG